VHLGIPDTNPSQRDYRRKTQKNGDKQKMSVCATWHCVGTLSKKLEFSCYYGKAARIGCAVAVEFSYPSISRRYVAIGKFLESKHPV